MALQHLSITDFGAMPLPLAPDGERAELVRQISIAMAHLNDLGSAVSAAKTSASQIDSCILSKAFRGALVEKIERPSLAAGPRP